MWVGRMRSVRVAMCAQSRTPPMVTVATTMTSAPQPTPSSSWRSAPARRARSRPHTGGTAAPCTRSPAGAAGEDLAEELTQDVFVAAWTSASRYDPERGALGGWLIGICRHKVVDALRRRERAAARVERAGALADPAPSTTEVDRMAERLAVADCLGILRPEARHVVELAFYSDMTHEQIADATGRPLGTVKAQIRRSLASMRRYLEGIDAAS